MFDRISRRSFGASIGAVLGALSVGVLPARQGQGAETKGSLWLATNAYPWQMFYRRAGRDYATHLGDVLAEVAAAGLDGFEPLVNSPAEIDQLAPLLAKNDLQMRSLYVNSVLHEPQKLDESVGQILAIAKKAKAIGTRMIVTNPSPIQWGGPENKSDKQLRFQAAALNRLGEELRAAGLKLAYHFHDMELRMAARELHHMMVATDPQLVSMCLDAHWVYRGSGDSEVAVFDMASLYADRIAEVHIRQSRGGVWTEAFGDGDIDYAQLVELLAGRNVRPLLVLEQAVEDKSPNTMTAQQAHAQGANYARRVFAPLAGKDR